MIKRLLCAAVVLIATALLSFGMLSKQPKDNEKNYRIARIEQIRGRVLKTRYGNIKVDDVSGYKVGKYVEIARINNKWKIREVGD